MELKTYLNIIHNLSITPISWNKEEIIHNFLTSSMDYKEDHYNNSLSKYCVPENTVLVSD